MGAVLCQDIFYKIFNIFSLTQRGALLELAYYEKNNYSDESHKGKMFRLLR